jgi:hypothetical protein
MRKLVLIASLLGCTLQTAFANGFFQSVSGDVRAGPTGAPSVAIAPNARITEGTTVTTGPNGRATIRLDDGHALVLAENSEFVLNTYRFDRATPASSNIAAQLLKGALRSLSGLIGGKNPGRFALATSTSTIGIRGTDFAVAIVNPTYVSVLSGAVDLSNTAGSLQVSAGANAIVDSALTLPTTIAAGALPASVAATFGQLNAVTIAAGAGAGAGGATAAATGSGISAGAVVGIAAAAAAVAAVISDSNTTGTTGTTGTR